MRPLSSTSWPTWRDTSGFSVRMRYAPVADLSALPFLSMAPTIAADGDELPARAADSVVPEPGGATDVTPLPPPGAPPTFAFTSRSGPVLAEAEPAVPWSAARALEPEVPTAPRSAPGCKQPVTVIVDC